MKRTYKKMSFGVLLCFLAVSPVISAGTGEEVTGTDVAATSSIKGSSPIPATTREIVITAAELFAAEALEMYNEMNLKKLGLSMKAFEYALKGYKNLVEHGKVMKDEVPGAFYLRFQPVVAQKKVLRYRYGREESADQYLGSARPQFRWRVCPLFLQ